jgi:hypothetical protein
VSKNNNTLFISEIENSALRPEVEHDSLKKINKSGFWVGFAVSSRTVVCASLSI